MAFPIGEGMPLAGLESTGNRREDIKKAAVQFEAFFLRQMLSEVRGSSEGGLLDQGPGAKMFKEMLDERLADSMAAQRAKPFQKLQRALAKQPQGRLEDQESRALVESLRETDQRWGAALERARSVVGDRAGALRRMKQMKGGGYGKR